VRILIVSQYFWPENFRVNDLARALVERGHTVAVLTGVPNYPEGKIYPEYRKFPERFAEFSGARIFRVPVLPRGVGALRLALNYLSFVITASTVGVARMRGTTWDAIFVYQPSPITSCLPALVLGRVKRAPVLLWTLDLWPESLEAVGAVTSATLLRHVGRLVSFIYRRCALVLGQSSGFQDNVERYSGSATRFRYFPQWSEDLFDSQSTALALAPEMARFHGQFNIVFAGNIGDAQDFPAILDAADQLKHRRDISWVLIGDGRAAAWLKAEIVNRELSETVFMLGRFPLERMASFFCGASALLVSLKRDPVFALTIPGKVQTYLAAGLPLVAMLDGEGARVIEASGAGFTCAAGDSTRLASHVERMSALSLEVRRSMGECGVAYAKREFGREQLLAQLEGWIAQVATARAVEDV
jgi:colanic acid biosynthesis glycosyl transferase WcaI